MLYDYLIVGAGLFGSVFACEAGKRGKKVLVVDKRLHVGGNIFTKEMEGIQVHEYGAHIFHTSDEAVWKYVNQFATFNRYTNSPLARYGEELYNMPFNMNTFHAMWGGVRTPEEARAKIKEQIREAGIETPKNLEEQAICLVGKDIYEKLVKGYTEKQWGKRATELPAFIIQRLPVRFVYDNNYFNDAFQGIPIGGYTQIIEKMLDSSRIEVRLNTDFLKERNALCPLADRIVYTGMIDAYYDYCFGELEYRSLRFETEVLNLENYQGNAVINYTEYEVPYTRMIEHKHFEFQCQREKKNPKTVITKEYPHVWKHGDEPYYPLNDEKNNARYQQYRSRAEQEKNVIFGGRLGLYRYFDMHQVVAEALSCAETELA